MQKNLSEQTKHQSIKVKIKMVNAFIKHFIHIPEQQWKPLICPCGALVTHTLHTRNTPRLKRNPFLQQHLPGLEWDHSRLTSACLHATSKSFHFTPLHSIWSSGWSACAASRVRQCSSCIKISRNIFHFINISHICTGWSYRSVSASVRKWSCAQIISA